MNDGLWLLDQLSQADPDAHIRVRVRGKSNHIPLTHAVKCSALYDDWRSWLFTALVGAVERGGMVEFGVNPRTSKFKKGPMPPCLPLAIVVNFRVGKDYTLEERFQQVSFLLVANFQPSILIQRHNRLCGIYLLDTPTDETMRFNLAIRLNKLIHSSQWKDFVKPDCLLPLPGFAEYSKKESAKLVFPDALGAAKLYTITEFENFPDAGKESHAEYYKRAQADPEDAKRFLAGLIEQAKRLGDRRGVLAGAMIDRTEAKMLRVRRKLGIFQEPTKTDIPPIETLNALSYHALTQIYVRQGASMKRETMRKFVRALLKLDLGVNINVDDAVTSIDEAIIGQFIELGFTYHAVMDFYNRTGYLCGLGKTPEYIWTAYSKVIKRLRSACTPPVSPVRSSPLLDCVTTACRMLPELSKEERAEYALLRGDILFLHAKKTYRLYRAAMISQNVTPHASTEIAQAINHLEAPYWLGCRMIDGHKMWGLSMKFVQSLGLLPNTSILQPV